MSEFISSCKIKINADGDWQILPPDGQITRIGEAGGGFVPGVSNNDFLVAGKIGAYGEITGAGGISSVGDTEIVGAVEFTEYDWNCSGTVSMRQRSEVITIPVGNGAAGVVSVASMFQPNIIVLSINVRVTQAPGGGAITFDITRTGTPADVLIDDMAVALDTVGTSITDSDGTHDGPFYNAITATLTITTNANVTGSDMKVRVGMHYIQLWHFDS